MQPSRGILGNLDQFSENTSAVQMPPAAAWNALDPLGPAMTYPWPPRLPAETYDPDALRFAAAWRGTYSAPLLPSFGPPNHLSRSYLYSSPAASQLTKLTSESNSAQPPNSDGQRGFASDVSRDNRRVPGTNYAADGHQEFPQRLQDVAGTSYEGNDASQFVGWQNVDVPAPSMTSADVVPASYQARTRPWWVPVSPWDTWNEQAIEGLSGLYNYLKRGPRSSGDRDAPGCKEEWDAARRDCANWLAGPNPPRGPTGGYLDIENCARGLVSEKCGGNPVKR